MRLLDEFIHPPSEPATKRIIVFIRLVLHIILYIHTHCSALSLRYHQLNGRFLFQIASILISFSFSLWNLSSPKREKQDLYLRCSELHVVFSFGFCVSSSSFFRFAYWIKCNQRWKFELEKLAHSNILTHFALIHNVEWAANTIPLCQYTLRYVSFYFSSFLMAFQLHFFQWKKEIRFNQTYVHSF